MLVASPKWLDTGSNAWQMAAATFVGLQSVPGLVILGKSSLGVYVAHLVVLYGWAGDEGLVTRWARQLSMVEALGVAAVVLAMAVAMAKGVPSALRWLEEKAAPRWPQPSGEPG